MRTSYSSGVYWSARAESAAECARRTEQFLRSLTAFHPDYAHWFQTGDSLEEALQREFIPDPPTLLGIFNTEENNKGPLGFSFSCWTGHADDNRGGGLFISCGGSIPKAPPNSCQLSLPRQGTEFGKQILTRSALTALMRALVLAWDPDWGIIVADAVRDRLGTPSLPGTYVGWLTYITRRWGEVPALPEVQSIEPIEDKGSLVVLTDEPLSPTPAHLDRCLRVQQHLSARGLLRGF